MRRRNTHLGIRHCYRLWWTATTVPERRSRRAGHIGHHQLSAFYPRAVRDADSMPVLGAGPPIVTANAGTADSRRARFATLQTCHLPRLLMRQQGRPL